MTDREWAYGKASDGEIDNLNGAILDLLHYECTEEELGDALGHKLPDEMNLYSILQELEKVNLITSQTTYREAD